MHSLAERLLSHIRRHEMMSAGDRVGVAVSGGIDSVALLRLLLELRSEVGMVLSVLHFNHRLRSAESDADEQFVAGIAHRHQLEFHPGGADVSQFAAEEGLSVEAAARELRYEFLHYWLGAEGQEGLPHAQKLDKVATGHTLDDQAETVLLRLIRGSGLRGLGGIHPRIPVEDEDEEFCGEIVRPLLETRHRELQAYLNEIGQAWREDSSNADGHFTRNRVRKLVVPMLEREFNPAIAGNLAELAEIARGEEDYWENEVAGWMGTGVHWSEPEWAQAAYAEPNLVQIGGTGPMPVADDGLRTRIENASWLVANASVSRMWFLGEPVAVQRRLIKAIGERAGIPLEFKHVEEIRRCAGEDGARQVSLPLGWKLRIEAEQMLFATPDLRAPRPAEDYEYRVSVPGTVAIELIQVQLELRVIPAAAVAGYNPDHLLDAQSLPGPFVVRNWRAGDRFWPAHSKSPKKIKELLQERHESQPERRLWPVVLSGEEIVWMRGLPAAANHRPKAGQEAILIAERALAVDRKT